MSLYGDFANTALLWIYRQQEAKTLLEELIVGLKGTCEIPNGHLRYLPWDEEKQVFSLPHEEKSFTFADAAHFDEEMQAWGVGVMVSASPLNKTSVAMGTFGLYVKAVENGFRVKLASRDWEPASSGDIFWNNKLFRAVMSDLNVAFTLPAQDSDQPNHHGFYTRLSLPTEA